MSQNNQAAGLKLRLLAFYTDTLFFLLVHLVFFIFIAQSSTIAEALSRFFLYLILIAFNPLLLFQTTLTTYYFGATLGKLLTGLRVVSWDYKKLSFKRILFRQTLGYQFAALIFGLGFFSIAKDTEKTGWHDKAAGSRVIVVQNHWPFALIMLIFLIIFKSFLFINAATTIVNGPLVKEFGIFWQKVESEMEEKDARGFNKKFATTYDEILLLYKNEDYSQAKRKAQTLLLLTKTSYEKAVTYQALGEIAIAQKNTNEATLFLNQSLTYDNTSAYTYWLLANNDYTQQPDQALLYMQKTVLLEPENSRYHYTYGILLYASGKHREGRAEVAKAIELSPEVNGYKTTLQQMSTTPLSPTTAPKIKNQYQR